MFWSSSWKEARDYKQEQRRTALAAGEQLLADSKVEISPSLGKEILSSNASQIATHIKSRTKGWTATSVLLVYIKSAIRAQRDSNVLTEILFEDAVRRAKELDEELERTGEVRGALHGVPVSLKDQIDFEGYDSTIGVSRAINKPAETHAAPVKVLLAAGANPFVKTTVPQTMLSFECSSPLWGISTNPYDKERIPGGSSGGEAALLASDGSPLGFGSDIGGSLRIPAHFSGCYGLKPCHSRFPVKGAATANPGFQAIEVTMGPMGRSVADLELATRVVVDASVGHEAQMEGLVPLKYREVELPEKLKFGYYLTDGFCRASPACERAVLETVEALRKKGHECVEFVPHDPIKGLELFAGITSADGYKTLLSSIGSDPVESSLFLTITGPKIPSFIRLPLVWIIEHLVGDGIFSRALASSRVKSSRELQHWQHQRDLYADEFRKQVWGELKLDAILCAPQATPAQKVGETWDLSPLAMGTFLYNIVDTTVGVLPVTFVDAVKDAFSDDWFARGKAGSKIIEKKVYQGLGGVGAVYDAEAMEGIPVGVQVVGKHWEEEKVVEMMKVVDEALGPRGFGPGKFVQKGERE
ncbi:amidase signature enzyme [Leucosporidium creatinivorum]|uniref:amidase n=1 Tax=Leucosporidium creatinivorum TaxID=106004 RepID=A0A1Y2G663_9BASI|nr:amidase signature enzyme [Leucosporidium creatinivorum]